MVRFRVEKSESSRLSLSQFRGTLLKEVVSEVGHRRQFDRISSPRDAAIQSPGLRLRDLISLSFRIIPPLLCCWPSNLLALAPKIWFLQSRMQREELTGADIKAWREGIGRPRRWLADQLGVSAKTVESWEYGVRNPSGPAPRLIEQLMNQNPPRK